MNIAIRDVENMITVIMQQELIRIELLEGLTNSCLSNLLFELSRYKKIKIKQETSSNVSILLSFKAISDLCLLLSGASSVLDDDAFEGVSDEQIMDLSEQIFLIKVALRSEKEIRYYEKTRGVKVPRFPKR